MLLAARALVWLTLAAAAGSPQARRLLFRLVWGAQLGALAAVAATSSPERGGGALLGPSLAAAQAATLASLAARLATASTYRPSLSLAAQLLLVALLHARLAARCGCGGALAPLSRAAVRTALAGDGLASTAWQLYDRACAATCEVERRAAALSAG